MAKNVLISEMLKFRFGNTVFCANGQAGSLVQVLFDVDSRRLTQVAVKQGHVFSKTFYVPFEAVSGASGDGIWLNLTLEQLAASPRSAGPGVELDAHTGVRGSAASGTLVQVAVHAGSGELASIVAHNVPGGRDTLLPARYISDLAPGQISITADASDLNALPPYRPDSELQKEVEDIIFDLGFLHIDLKGLRLRVLDSVLYMNGNISSTLRGELARNQVAGVNGLLEIKNNLVGDDTLAADIAHALGQNEQTRDLPIGVYPQLGVVRLSGSVRTARQKEAAGALAAQFEGVRGVINDLVVDPSADMLYVMSAPEGGEAKDITPGSIRHTK